MGLRLRSVTSVFGVGRGARGHGPGACYPVAMFSTCRLRAVLCVSVAAVAVTASAQAPTGTLTLDTIYDPDVRVNFSGAPTTNLRWIDDSSYLQTRRAQRGVEWMVVDAVSGRTASRAALPSGLSKREADVIVLMARGMTNKEIGVALFISSKTVEHHVGHIYDKIATRTRAEAALFAVQHGLTAQ